MTDKITEDMAGCWLDGHHGWHNTYRVVHRAMEWGFPLDSEDDAFIDQWIRWRGGDMNADEETEFEDGYPEHMDELSDQATEYLQSLAPEGFAFDWDAGELSLRCLCQIEGTEEYGEALASSSNQCAACDRRYGA